MSALRCPSCDGGELTLFLTPVEVGSELELRDEFFHERFDGGLSVADSKDITSVALGVPASIFRCRQCRILGKGRGVVRTPDDLLQKARMAEVLLSAGFSWFRLCRGRESLARGTPMIEVLHAATR